MELDREADRETYVDLIPIEAWQRYNIRRLREEGQLELEKTQIRENVPPLPHPTPHHQPCQ